MLEQTCAICEKNYFRVLYKENFDIKKIDEKIFSARRLPDRLHYRMVQCRKCGLIYSNPILAFDTLKELYQKSLFNYDEQIDNLRETYGFYLRQLEKYGVVKNRLLEIGCGNGFFLEEALKQGYFEVYGVEPSHQAVSQSLAQIRPRITVDIFRKDLYERNFFDVICCFQTLDHLPDPNDVLKECYGVLRKDGLVLFLNHNVGSWTATLFGDKSPIIDIEHTYLYSKTTMRKIFTKHKFKILKIDHAYNIHYLNYWIRLVPFPDMLKRFLTNTLRWFRLDHLRLKMYPGNLVLFGRK